MPSVLGAQLESAECVAAILQKYKRNDATEVENVLEYVSVTVCVCVSVNCVLMLHVLRLQQRSVKRASQDEFLKDVLYKGREKNSHLNVH